MPHLLLVDANEISQKVISKQLSSEYALSVVSDLKDAKINLARSHFDALLLSADDGFDELLRWVYDLRRPDSPMAERAILLLTSRYGEDLAFRAWRAGVNTTVAKPINGADLRALLSQQITAPGNAPVPRSSCQVELVTWIKGGLHYLYSPDLDRLVTASSEEQAMLLMDELFEQFWYRFEQSRFGEARVKVKRRRFAFRDWQDEEHIVFDGSRAGADNTPPVGGPVIDSEHPPAD